MRRDYTLQLDSIASGIPARPTSNAAPVASASVVETVEPSRAKKVADSAKTPALKAIKPDAPRLGAKPDRVDGPVKVANAAANKVTNSVPERVLATDPAPRYGVTFEDLVDPEDRTHWIAGSIVKVMDLETNEEIARHTRFAFDQGLGGRAGARTPWASPLLCPVIGPSYAST